MINLDITSLYHNLLWKRPENRMIFNDGQSINHLVNDVSPDSMWRFWGICFE